MRSVATTITSANLRLSDRIMIVVRKIDEVGATFVFDNFHNQDNAEVLDLIMVTNQHSKKSKTIMTCQEWIDTDTFFNPVNFLKLPLLAEDEAVLLLKQLSKKIGGISFTQDELNYAYKRITGHPYYLRLLVSQSSLLPLSQILEELNQLGSKVWEHLRSKVFGSLDINEKQLLALLSFLRRPFSFQTVRELLPAGTDISTFEILIKRFLVSKSGDLHDETTYEIHSLLREYAISQLSAEERHSMHVRIASYYESLSYDFVRYTELLHHQIESNHILAASSTLEQLLGHLLFSGLFEYVLEFTDELLKHSVNHKFAILHFARGRAFRFKELFTEARSEFQLAIQTATDARIRDTAKYELASCLMKDPVSSSHDMQTAKNHYIELSNSETSVRISSFTTLGVFLMREGQIVEAIKHLEAAIELAEKQGSSRQVAEACQMLGQAYLQGDEYEKAKLYFERTLTIRSQNEMYYGDQDIEGQYHLFDAIANVNIALGNIESAIQYDQKCVDIDRKLKLWQRLGRSLFQLGRDNCLHQNYKQALSALTEAFSIVDRYEIKDGAKRAVIEWLVVALWYSKKKYQSIEKYLEYHYVCELNNIEPKIHLFIYESDIKKSGIVSSSLSGFHLLILPDRFSFDKLNEIKNRVVRKRPELDIVSPYLFHNP